MKAKLITTSQERLYLYGQSQQIRGQTGFIGHLRGDFGSDGNEFWTTWFPAKNADRYRYYSTHRPLGPGTYPKPQGNEVLVVENYSTPAYIAEIGKEAWGYIEYKRPVSPVLLNDFELCGGVWRAELDMIVNALREHEQPLECRGSMKAWGNKCPDAEFAGICGSEYGLRVDSELFTFMFRFNPAKGDYNSHCFVYTKQWFDDHLKKSAKGIRFITPNYDKLFRIEDGGHVRVTYPPVNGGLGRTEIYPCRYIDDCHAYIGNNLYHICEFSELIERNGGTVEPVGETIS